MRGILALFFVLSTASCGFLDDEIAAELEHEHEEYLEGLSLYGSASCGGGSFSLRTSTTSFEATTELQPPSQISQPNARNRARTRAGRHSLTRHNALADPAIALFVQAEKEVDTALKHAHAGRLD